MAERAEHSPSHRPMGQGKRLYKHLCHLTQGSTASHLPPSQPPFSPKENEVGQKLRPERKEEHPKRNREMYNKISSGTRYWVISAHE
jgi:hypothetical protein